MEQMPSSRRAVVAAFLVSIFAAACASSATPLPAPIRIALEAPLTGAQSSNGVDQLHGAQLAVKEANDGGGVLGRQIELVPVDDQADPEVGVAAARQAIAGGLFAVVGPYNSSVGARNLDIYLQAGVIPIHMTSNSVTNGKGFTVQPKDYQIAPIEAKAIAGFFKAKRVAIVYDPSTYTKGIAEQLRALVTDARIELVANQPAEPGQGSYVDLLKGIASKQPDLFYASTYFPEGGAMAKGLPAAGLSAAKCLMGLANQDPGFVGAAGLEAARSCSSSGVPSADQFAGASQYVAGYRREFGGEPGTWGSFTYDSVKLLVDAVKRAGGWDGAKVRDALSGTTGYDGITGRIAIDPQTGNRVNVPVVILAIDGNGRYVVDPDWARFAGFATGR
jgi:branched-chain amino acid transport system substrate-binding protein